MTNEDRSRIPDEELVTMARDGMDDLATVDNDHVASLWDAIAAEAFADDDAEATPVVPADVTRDAPRLTVAPDLPADDATDPSDRTDAPPGDATPADGTGSVVRLEDRRARREGISPMAWMGAAAAAIILVVGGVWVVTQPSTEQLATFAMAPLDDRVATEVDGDIVVDGDTTIVELDLSALPELTTGEFYELWLLDLDNGELVSLGEVDATTTAVPIDTPVNAAAFPVIDVSVEPADGEPAHSGDSVLRGPITAADTPS